LTTASSQTDPRSPAQLEETPRPREVAPARLPNPFAAPPRYASQAKSTSSLDWETIIGGRWLNRTGIVALIGATTFFLKYAFDNNRYLPTLGQGLLMMELRRSWRSLTPVSWCSA